MHLEVFSQCYWNQVGNGVGNLPVLRAHPLDLPYLAGWQGSNSEAQEEGGGGGGGAVGFASRAINPLR